MYIIVFCWDNVFIFVIISICFGPFSDRDLPVLELRTLPVYPIKDRVYFSNYLFFLKIFWSIFDSQFSGNFIQNICDAAPPLSAHIGIILCKRFIWNKFTTHLSVRQRVFHDFVPPRRNYKPATFFSIGVLLLFPAHAPITISG